MSIKRIEAIFKFLKAARNLVKNKDMSKDQVIAFAKQEFGEIDDFFKLQIDNLFKKPKVSSPVDQEYKKQLRRLEGYLGSLDRNAPDFQKAANITIKKIEKLKRDYKAGKFVPEGQADVVPIKEDIMSADDAGSAMAEWARKNDPEGYAKMQKVADDANQKIASKKALEKRTDDIMKEDIGEEKGILTLTDELKQKLKDYRKTQEEMGQSKGMFDDIFDAMIGFRRATGSKDKAKPFRTPGMPFQKENPGYRTLGGSMYAEGNLRTAMREFLKTEHKAGRLKLDETDLFRITEYSPRSIDDPIDVFRRYYGEDALEAADAMASKLEKGTSFKNYEEIFRANMPELNIKTQGAGLYDQSIIDAEKVLKELKDQKDYAKTLDEFDITGRTKNADGGIIGNLHLNRTGFSSGSEFIGPTWESPKKSLDDIIGNIIGKREDRPDFNIVGLSAGPMGRSAGRRDEISSSIIQDTTANLAKAMLYGIKNYKKEDQQTLYSFMDNGIKLKIDNQATGIETGVAEKFNLNVPTRIDDNTLLSVALDTYNKLPADLQAKIKASTNLAKDESWSALVEGNNLGITYNSDNQKIEGHYDVKLDSETLKPTIIRPKFEKDNIDNETIHSMFIGHGDFPPNPENFMNPEHYQMAMQAWSADKDKEYFGIDLVSKPNSDYKGVKGTFDTKNLSGWGAVEKGDNTNVAALEATGTIPNYLLEDVEPIELSTSLYKDLDTDDKEALIRADIPVSDSLTPYIQSTTGDWGDDLKYGINLDKTGQLGNWNYLLTGNIDQDKDYNIGADLTTELMGGNVGVQGWYDADDNWYTGIGGKWSWGEPEKKSRTSTHGFNNPEEALKFAETKNLFADGGLANILKIK